MHILVSAYAGERLEDDGDADIIRHGLLKYGLHLLERGIQGIGINSGVTAEMLALIWPHLTALWPAVADGLWRRVPSDPLTATAQLENWL